MKFGARFFIERRQTTVNTAAKSSEGQSHVTVAGDESFPTLTGP